MSDTPSKSPIVKMIVKLTEQYFIRLHEGKMQYPKDAETLRYYAKAALKLNEPLTAGSVLLTEGLIHIYAGKLDAALDVFRQAYTLFEAEYDFVHIAACTNNVAYVHEIRGEFDLALACYRKGLEMVSWMADDYTTDASILSRGSMLQILKTNEALIYLSLGDYPQAKSTFEVALAYLDDQRLSNLECMLEIRRGLAEVYLAQGDFKAARSSILLADELAPVVNNNFLEAGLYFTHAHLAQKIPDYGASPTEYFARVADLLSSVQAPILYARVLLGEARFQKQVNNLEMAQRFAQQAHDIFAQQGIDEERRLAAELIETGSTS